MPAIHETAYPRLKSSYSEEELSGLYSPTSIEIRFVQDQLQDFIQRVTALSLLKVFQRLGYFPLWKQVPASIPLHITHCLGHLFIPTISPTYDTSGTRSRHLKLIRDFLGVQPLSEATYQTMQNAALRAAQTKEHLADIVNVMLEELVKERMELPAFSKFVREARAARGHTNRQCFQAVAGTLSHQQQQAIDTLLSPPVAQTPSTWDRLKQEPAKPTTPHIRAYLAYVRWLRGLKATLTVPLGIGMAKQEQFYYEAYATNLTDMNRFPPDKRYTFAVILLTSKWADTLDDLAQIFIKLLQGLHTKAKAELEAYHAKERGRVEALIGCLAEVTTAFQTAIQMEGSLLERWATLASAMPNDTQQVIDECHRHLAYAQNNHYLCLLPFYHSKRSLLFDCVEQLELHSSSNDHSLEEAIALVSRHRHHRKEWLDLNALGIKAQSLNLDWISDKWRKLVTGKADKEATLERHNRKYFELCVFSELMRQLKSGDMYVEGSQEFDDYRQHLMDESQVKAKMSEYETLTGIPTQADVFVKHLRQWLLEKARQVDDSFPKNASVRLENGQLIITRKAAVPASEDYLKLDGLLKERMQPINILEVIIHSEKWLNLSHHFHALSGYESRLEEYSERLITTFFCYGCNLGPSQTARSVTGVNRKQLAWINAHHVTEDRLNEAIVRVINSYNRFVLPKFWGTGKRASADGTKWNLYEQNLLSEYHIRYGGYGGIGYYHVSDTYIALFSHFIPCGVYEAVHLLDGLIKNTSDIQPDTLHGDTQAQSIAVFGLAYLLGIKLMPRIRNLHDLSLFRPDKETAFRHLEALFSDAINWELIETHLPDMLQVVLSIQAGRITPSTILRRLGTYSRKNKLYFAFRALGRVVRTVFLLDYYHDEKLRSTIQAATNNSEEFNDFIKWTAFGNPAGPPGGSIAENLRHEQRKVIKYNHLVANMLIMYNVDEMTRVLSELLQEGYPITPEVLPLLSPYRKDHINRFGNYILDLKREVPPLRVDAQLFSRSDPEW